MILIICLIINLSDNKTYAVKECNKGHQLRRYIQKHRRVLPERCGSVPTDKMAQNSCHISVGWHAHGQHRAHHQKYIVGYAEKQYKFNTIRLFMFV